MSTDERMSLKGEEAIALWKQGKDAWNDWVKEHPEADVDFANVDFSQYRDDPSCRIPADAWPFAGFRFPRGSVNFSRTQFGEGRVSFFQAQFKKGDVSFASTRIQGDFTLSHATLGTGAYNFERCDFEQRAFLDELKDVEQVEFFSFRYASFEKPLVLSTANNAPLGCVVDLTDTRINSHVSLQGLTIQPKGTTQKDIGRFCRLKELAENNKDHERALAFKAQEMRVIRQHQATGIAKCLNWCFDFFSHYGRSEWRPLFGLMGVWGLFGLIYRDVSQSVSRDWGTLHESLVFSFSQMFPLIPGFRESREGALRVLFPSLSTEAFLPLWLSVLTFFQSLLAIIFLFLLGLTLHNRFRL